MKGIPARHIRRHADRDAGVKFTPRAGSRTPFKAAFAMMHALSKANEITEPAHRELALAAIPPLRSRGHGGKHRVFQRQVLGRAMKDRSRYVPRQCDRRTAARTIANAMRSMLVTGA